MNLSFSPDAFYHYFLHPRCVDRHFSDFFCFIMTTYGTAPTGYVKPAPVIVYREAGDCPSCRVGSNLPKKNSRQMDSSVLGRTLRSRNILFGCILLHYIFPSRFDLFTHYARTKMSQLWIFQCNNLIEFLFFCKMNERKDDSIFYLHLFSSYERIIVKSLLEFFCVQY